MVWHRPKTHGIYGISSFWFNALWNGEALAIRSCSWSVCVYQHCRWFGCDVRSVACLRLGLDLIWSMRSRTVSAWSDEQSFRQWKQRNDTQVKHSRFQHGTFASPNYQICAGQLHLQAGNCQQASNSTAQGQDDKEFWRWTRGFQ